MHNEATRGFPVLPVLGELASSFDFHVVVVCNGCTDSSAAMARAVGGLEVVELDVASKSEALNAGDRAAGTTFPRLYLDADVQVTAAALQQVADALRADPPAAGGPNVRFDTTGSPWLVRRYFRGLEILPFLVGIRSHHLEGRGLFGVNEAGRSRFEEFPPLLADDAFFDRMFSEEEKLNVTSAEVRLTYYFPSNRAFLRGRSRSAQGSYELATWLASHRPDRQVVSSVQTTPLDGLLERVRRHHRSAGLIDGWSYDSISALLAVVVTESYARSTAAIRRRRGATARWR